MGTLAKLGRGALALVINVAIYYSVAMVGHWLVSGFATWAGIESKIFLVLAMMLVGVPPLMGLVFWMSCNATMQRFNRWLQRDRTMARALAEICTSLLLFILLAALNVTGAINWSWWWVTVPLWYFTPLLWSFPALLLYMTVLELIALPFLKIWEAIENRD